MVQKRGKDFNHLLTVILIIVVVFVILNTGITGEALRIGRYRLGSTTTTQTTTTSQLTVVNANPIGWHDTVSPDCSVAKGWTCDPNDYTKQLFVQIFDASQNNKLVGKGYASLTRESAVAQACGNNANHGFGVSLDNSLKNGGQHVLFARATDANTGSLINLSGTPKTVTCPNTLHCFNGVKDSGESDVDCGGGTCPGCDYGKSCGAGGWLTDSNCKTGLKCLDTYPSVSGQNRMSICGTITETDGGYNLGLAGTITKTAGAYSLSIADVCINSTLLNETESTSTYNGYRVPMNCVRTITVCNVGNTSCNQTSTTQCSAGRCI